jgi:hypothetical protein
MRHYVKHHAQCTKLLRAGPKRFLFPPINCAILCGWRTTVASCSYHHRRVITRDPHVKLNWQPRLSSVRQQMLASWFRKRPTAVQFLQIYSYRNESLYVHDTAYFCPLKSMRRKMLTVYVTPFSLPHVFSSSFLFSSFSLFLFIRSPCAYIWAIGFLQRVQIYFIGLTVTQKILFHHH